MGKGFCSFCEESGSAFSLSKSYRKAKLILLPAEKVLNCLDGRYHQAASQQGALIHQPQGFPKAFCLHLLLSLAGTLSENKRLLPRVRGLAFIKMIMLFYQEHLLDQVHEACKEGDDKEEQKCCRIFFFPYIFGTRMEAS